MTRSIMNCFHTLSVLGVAAAVIVAAGSGSVAVCRGDDPPGCEADSGPDLTTARSATLAWIDAAWNGDAGVAHQILVDDEDQRRFLADILRFSAAVRRLEAAAVKRFGEPGKQVTGYPDGSAKAMEGQLTVTIDGDRATASVRDAPLPLTLRLIDGRWRVDLSEMIQDPRARRAADASAAAADVAEQVAREVADGKFKTADAARTAFRERRLAQVKK